jgi:trk system potassium uptake protein
MLVAVTQSDETNLVACRLAATLFNIPTRIARIRSPPIFWHPRANFCPSISASITSSAPSRKSPTYLPS